MTLRCRRLWKRNGAERTATAEVVGRQGFGLRALRAATADCGRNARLVGGLRSVSVASADLQLATDRHNFFTYFIYDKCR